MTERRSKLTDDELFELWVKFKARSPEIAARYFDTEFQAKASNEEWRSDAGAMQSLVAQEFPALRSYPERSDIYFDMNHFGGNARVKELFK
jgi:hypothetical protein